MKNIILTFVVALFMVSCSSKNIVSKSYTSENIYSSYNITYPQDTNMTSKYEIISQNLQEKLQKQNIKNGSDLQIDIKFASYDEGNRFLRYVIGFGAGQAKIIVVTNFYNNNKKHLGTLQTQANIAAGLLGGGSDTSLSLVADKIISFAKKHYFVK